MNEEVKRMKFYGGSFATAPDGDWVSVRHLAAAQSQIAALEKELAHVSQWREIARERVKELTARCAVLEKALREISEIGWSPRDGHIRIARAALAPEVAK
jgi:septal ring factor EnvC (AmiA/AmiB activator)